MVTIPTDPKEIIKASLEFEEEGYKLFIDSIAKATDPLTKSTFQFLADQEIKHMETIKTFASSLEGTDSFDLDTLPETINVPKAKQEIRNIFAQIGAEFDGVVGDEDERMEVYKVAMKLESRGHDFYGTASDQATDDNARRIYRFLSDEEAQHYMIIQDTFMYLMQPDAFMAIDEHWMIS